MCPAHIVPGKNLVPRHSGPYHGCSQDPRGNHPNFNKISGEHFLSVERDNLGVNRFTVYLNNGSCPGLISYEFTINVVSPGDPSTPNIIDQLGIPGFPTLAVWLGLVALMLNIKPRKYQ